MSDLEDLRSHLTTLGRVILGYSGGVDSSLLAVVSRQALPREDFLAVIGRSASYPAVQADAALTLAAQFDIPVFELETNELQDARYLSNSTDRCYYCKSELWTQLSRLKAELGFDTIIDGTNADDVGEHRPGTRAGGEHQVRSPLLDLGWTKHRIRLAAEHLAIPVWDAPAAPCLSSRILYGLQITPERLRQVEQGEEYLRRLGVQGDLRVRHHGESARLEVAPGQMDIVRQQWDSVALVFAELGFAAVELDPQGYRRGGLLSLARPASQ